MRRRSSSSVPWRRSVRPGRAARWRGHPGLSAGRAHRRGDPFRAAGRTAGGGARARRGGCRRAPAHPPDRRRRRRRGAACRGGEGRGLRLARRDFGQRGRPLRGRAERRAARWASSASPRSGRRPPTRSAWPGSNRTWCPPSTVPAASSRCSPRPIPRPIPARRARPLSVRGHRARDHRRGPGREGLVGGSGHRLPDRPRADSGARGAGAGVGGRRRGLHRDLVGPGLQGAAGSRRCSRPGARPRGLHRAHHGRGGARPPASPASTRHGVRPPRGSWRSWPTTSAPATAPRSLESMVAEAVRRTPPPTPRGAQPAFRRGARGGCGGPRRSGASWPRPGSASTTWSPRCSCARASTHPPRSRPCRARCSTRSTRSCSRRSGSCRSGCRGSSSSGCPRPRTPRAAAPGTPTGVVQVALRDLRDALGDELVVMADLCLDEYTDHGHCGVLGPTGVVQRRDARALRASPWPRPRRAPTWSPRAG